MENKYYQYCIEKLSLTKNTARYKTNLVKNYLQWLKKNNINIKKMTYTKLLDYIGYLQERIIVRRIGSLLQARAVYHDQYKRILMFERHFHRRCLIKVSVSLYRESL